MSLPHKRPREEKEDFSDCKDCDDDDVEDFSPLPTRKRHREEEKDFCNCDHCDEDDKDFVPEFELKYSNGQLQYRNIRIVEEEIEYNQWAVSCFPCYDEDGDIVRGKYPDETGKKRLCSGHSREINAYKPDRPCEMCIDENAKSILDSGFPNAKGQRNKLCSGHAVLAGTHQLQTQCEICLIGGKQATAHHPNKEGRANKLCAQHAQDAGTYIKKGLCQICVERNVPNPLRAHYPNTFNQPDKFCSGHAHEFCTWESQPYPPCIDCVKAETEYPLHALFPSKNSKYCTEHAKFHNVFEVLNPCELCVAKNIKPPKQGICKNTAGAKRKVCVKHAKHIGTYEVINPCEDCTKEACIPIMRSGYANEAGQKNKLCINHAYKRGLIAKPYPKASKVACQFFDRIKRDLQIDIQHIHFTPGQDIPEGKESIIPGTLYKPDGRLKDNDKIFYEFFGNTFHGHPPEHVKFQYEDALWPTRKTSQELYEGTMERLHTISKLGYTIHYVWEHEWREVTRTKDPRPVQDVIHTFDSKIWEEYLLKQDK